MDRHHTHAYIYKDVCSLLSLSLSLRCRYGYDSHLFQARREAGRRHHPRRRCPCLGRLESYPESQSIQEYRIQDYESSRATKPASACLSLGLVIVFHFFYYVSSIHSFFLSVSISYIFVKRKGNKAQLLLTDPSPP